MCSVQELQQIDRELFSELIETLINPAFFYIPTLFVDGYNPMFYLQNNREGLWQLQGYVIRNTDVLRAILQDNFSKNWIPINAVIFFSSWKHCEEQSTIYHQKKTEHE